MLCFLGCENCASITMTCTINAITDLAISVWHSVLNVIADAEIYQSWVVYSDPGDVPLFSFVNHIDKGPLQGAKYCVQWSGFVGTTRFVYYKETPLFFILQIMKHRRSKGVQLFSLLWSQFPLFTWKRWNRSRAWLHVSPCSREVHIARSCLFKKYVFIRLLTGDPPYELFFDT